LSGAETRRKRTGAAPVFREKRAAVKDRLERVNFMTFRAIAVLIVLLILPDCVASQLQRPSLTVIRRPASLILRTKPNREQRKRLEPHAQDVSRYAEFLRRPRTGIVRLMPDLGCTENVYIIKADDDCLNYIPESSYYSFREKEHTVEMLADVRFRNGFLVSDGFLAQGILVHLGEVDLEQLAPTSEGVDFLSNYAPHPIGLDAQKQYVELMRGVKVGKYLYKKAHPALENATYALRVVAYKGNVYSSFRGWRFDVLGGDNRMDLTLAFRVVRRDADGGITLLWREIERRESPRIVFPKRKASAEKR
jgi:hypothetical protein